MSRIWRSVSREDAATPASRATSWIVVGGDGCCRLARLGGREADPGSASGTLAASLPGLCPFLADVATDGNRLPSCRTVSRVPWTRPGERAHKPVRDVGPAQGVGMHQRTRCRVAAVVAAALAMAGLAGCGSGGGGGKQLHVLVGTIPQHPAEQRAWMDRIKQKFH